MRLWRSRIIATIAAVVAVALLFQTPVEVQEHRGRQTISAVDLSGLREVDTAIDSRLRAGDLRTYRTRANAFLPGRRSERLLQYYQGIPVYATDLNRQSDHGVTTSVFGTLFTGIDVDTTPGLSAEAARTVFGDLALDIVAHELAHGVTHFTAALGDTGPPNEPGAINEAFSDIIGTAVEFYVQESGTGLLRADYLLGEDADVLIRSLRDPQEIANVVTGPYPDHYSNLYRGPLDRGGVHLNAPILGHVYYLAIEGGTNRTSGQSVAGVGAANRLQIERIFFLL